MSTQYKKGSDVPTETITKRLDELATAITKGQLDGEFSMRVPAECDRDADLVIAEASDRLTALTRQRDMLSDYVRERADRCGHCDNCWSRCYINQAKQTLVAAGMEGKNDTRRTTEIL